MRALWQRSAFTAVLAASLGACASGSGKPADAVNPSTSTHKSLMDLALGEQIDYAGHRCGNLNLHVKTHRCLFPRR